MGKLLDSTTLGFLGASFILFAIVWGIKGPAPALSGLKSGLALSLRYALLIISSMVLATLFQTLVSREFITRHLGASSGWRGITLGSLIGALFPGSPYAAMPLFATLMQMGAGIPTGVAMVCAWGLLSIGRLPFQAAVMGGRFTAIQVARATCNLAMAVIAVIDVDSQREAGVFWLRLGCQPFVNMVHSG